MEWEDEDVRGQEHDVRDAQPWEQVVEQILHGSMYNLFNLGGHHKQWTYLSDRMVRLMELPTSPRMDIMEERIPHIIHLQ